jgi:hypothetical protein
MIYAPLFLIFFFYAMYDSLKKASRALQLLLVFMMGGVFIAESAKTLKAAKENIPVISKNLHGDIYAGYTPDWINYLKLSAWCVNLPKDSLVASRKGPMSSIYANGRDFFNVYRADERTSADSVIAMLKKNHVRYILIAKLRLNPSNPQQGYINTMDRLISPIARAYPKMLKFIRQEGATEEAQLWEIEYK